MYFIAMYPAPTFAIITLLLSFIVLLIAAISGVAYTCLYSNKKCCEKLCKTLILLLLIICLIGFIFFFTLIFVRFTLNGLSASSLGTIILSVTLPLIMFALSFHFRRYFIEVSSSNLSTNGVQGNRGYQAMLEKTV